MQVLKHVFSSGTYKTDSQYKPEMGSFYDTKVQTLDGKDTDLKSIAGGQVSLVTNVACLCGYTKGSYPKMVDFFNTYKDQGFTVLAFPCNQFGGQEPQTPEEIAAFVKSKFRVQFPLMAKIDVNGKNTHPAYQFLKKAFPGDITWNFASKFIVDRNGVPVRRFDKGASWEEIEAAIKELLAAQKKQDDAKTAEEKKGGEEKKSDAAAAAEGKKEDEGAKPAAAAAAAAGTAEAGAGAGAATASAAL